ncbi:cysteine hydrolase family protein [Pseudodesulfovibrio sp.]|uniref:cysteine hydrolase family protein n=1 Tax=unclassified Pseudodesulfovibrio TaxID=2661612 RepID=UPI003AFFB683
METVHNESGHAFPRLTKNAALLIIDMQCDGRAMVPTVSGIIPTIGEVLAAWRQAGLPVIFKKRVQRASGVDVERFRMKLFEQTPFLVEGTPGAEIFPELAPRQDEHIVRGTRFSGFFQTDLQLMLTRLGIQTLVICGVQTPNCIRATTMDALAYDYDVVLIEDAITAQTPAIHEANLLDMQNMGAKTLHAAQLI